MFSETDQPAPSGKRPHKARTYTELRELQAIAMKDCRNPDTPPQARAQLMRAYDVMEERIRVMRMRPAPKPLDVSRRIRKRLVGQGQDLPDMPEEHATPPQVVVPTAAGEASKRQA